MDILIAVFQSPCSLRTWSTATETRRPQALRISVAVDLATPTLTFLPSMPLSASKDYMDLKTAIEGLPKDIHFVLIEAVASHIGDALFEQDPRVRRVEVEIVKLAISHDGSIESGMARLAPLLG